VSGKRSQDALRGHVGEFGFVAPQGIAHASKLGAWVRSRRTAACPKRASHVSHSSRTFIVSDKRSLSVEMIDRLSEQISQLNVEIANRARRDETSRRLMTIARSTLVQLIPIGRGQVDRYR
jgi:hypothetical protein